MDYKEKYQNAFERAKKAAKDGMISHSFVDNIFGVQDSDDEKIRKWLIEMVEEIRKVNPTNAEHNGNCSEAIAYLERQKEQKWSPSEGEIRVLYKLCYISNQITDEDDTELTRLYQDLKRVYFNGHSFENMFSREKQKEQKPESCDCSRDEESYTNGIHHVLMNPEAYGLIKQQPAEWSEEDEGMLNCIIATLCEESHGGREANGKMVTWLENRLKSLRPQPKQEWSEEFLRLMGITISQDGNQVCVLLGENLAEGIAGFGDTLADAVEEFKKEWRQFDRFRKATWKPSDVQMEALAWYSGNSGVPPTGDKAIKSLYNDLKKL